MRFLINYVVLNLFFASLSVKAVVMPLQDRVLFRATDSEKRLLIVNNDSNAPVLLQSWVDDGHSDDISKEKNFPFAVIPAVVRMTPGKIINLKILPTEKVHGLPEDRESLFWVNLYEIPGVKRTPQLENANKMEIGLKTQLKIIYRPFKKKMDVINIGEGLEIRLSDSRHSLELDNPSPYYVTPVSIKIKSSSGEHALKLGMDRMIAPFSLKHFNIPEVINSTSIAVEYTLVDDAGKDATFTKFLN
ncbi:MULTISPECIES: fimbrial biogenesis chaperone [Pantoea]|uniref:fimbrial biogenesis chaperone n=1 Tax=Pantoea TaxID=53335 RepID=UPI000CF3B0BA|nr:MULTISPECIES: molecular chaperone [Pantoea]MCH9299875.1 molecular chaperone [Pantoea allii]PQK83738.1 phytochrome sensor protein [Pantoea ananatis]PQK87824.1 phytochrome sensor protein [Pantoea ananatis]PWV60373.1 P pilus assembly chaperone PapD [Pantoea ananatis]PWV83878.1 P pilus assembly chaperone PapD [Pantoea ananatis]